MMRKSRQTTLQLVCHAGEMGYFNRGQGPVFRWLADRGLIKRPERPHAWEYFITELGRAELGRLGFCPMCGGLGSYPVREGMGWTWRHCEVLAPGPPPARAAAAPAADNPLFYRGYERRVPHRGGWRPAGRLVCFLRLVDRHNPWSVPP